jgi:hypothetical protein
VRQSWNPNETVRAHTLKALHEVQDLKLEDDRLGLPGFALDVL